MNDFMGLGFLKTDVSFIFSETQNFYTESELEILEDRLLKELLENKEKYSRDLKKNIGLKIENLSDKSVTEFTMLELEYFIQKFPEIIDYDLSGNFIIDTKKISQEKLIKSIQEDKDLESNFHIFALQFLKKVSETQLEIQDVLFIKFAIGVLIICKKKLFSSSP